ncbi:MAG TPA: hypothetical protein VGK59_02295 [Ohtaekwangia sp.]
MRLSDEQVETIREYIIKSGIHLESLQEDVLDHLCCVLEDSKDTTQHFEKRLQEAIDDLAPDGLATLETETLFLLNSKKLVYMKKLMYLVGLGSSMTLAMGLCFKLLHWPGGDELLTYGFISFTLLFLPMTMIDKFKVKIQKSLSERLRFILGALSAISTGLAVLFKILNLYGGDFLLLVGAVLFSFGFLPFLFFTNYRKAVEQHF